MQKFLVYNFSGDLDEISHLFPNERLARIAAVVREHGGSVVVWDRANLADLARLGRDYLQKLQGLAFDESSPEHEERVNREAEEILRLDPGGIFVNLWHGTGFKFTVDLLKVLKARKPALGIYGVGQKVDEFSPEDILGLTGTNLDGLIAGLGYNAVGRLAAGEEFAGLPNAVFRREDRVVANPKEVVNVDDYPAPAYEADVYRHVEHKVPIYSLTLSNQACPNRCVFCIRPEKYGRTVRSRRTAAVVRELDELRFGCGITHFRIEDSTPPRSALTGLAKGILDSRLNGAVTLSGFSRVDAKSPEDFALLKRAGFLSLFFGLESLDDDELIRLKKGITYAAIRHTLESAHGAGLRTVGCFIFPLPGATRQGMETTLRRIAELRPVLDSVLVMPAIIMTPTAWGRNPEQFGIKLSPTYVKEGVIYPVKYLVPFRYWKPLPFSYDLMGKKAEDVTFDEIVGIQEEFVQRIRNEFKIPGIPDYYYLIAHLLQSDPARVSGEIVRCMMQRDFEGIRKLFGQAPVSG